MLTTAIPKGEGYASLHPGGAEADGENAPVTGWGTATGDAFISAAR